MVKCIQLQTHACALNCKTNLVYSKNSEISRLCGKICNMAVLTIIQVQEKLLRQPSRGVAQYDKKAQQLLKDLEDTLRAQKNPVGVGLAAPQIGKSLRAFLVKRGKEVIPFINPEIIWISDNTNDPKSRKDKKQKMDHENEYIMEGCLSLPHYYGPVKRAKSVTVRYQKPINENGILRLETVEETHTGLSAQIIQHEVDHLNGKLFIDRLLEQNRKLFRLVKGEWQEVELP